MFGTSKEVLLKPSDDDVRVLLYSSPESVKGFSNFGFLWRILISNNCLEIDPGVFVVVMSVGRSMRSFCIFNIKSPEIEIRKVRFDGV